MAMMFAQMRTRTRNVGAKMRALSAAPQHASEFQQIASAIAVAASGLVS
ncbi:hypothetical protein ACJMQP_11945 [Rhodopseudomonas palustris]